MSDIKVMVTKLPETSKDCPFAILDLEWDYDYVCTLDHNFNICPLVLDKPCDKLIAPFEKGEKNEENPYDIVLLNNVR